VIAGDELFAIGPQAFVAIAIGIGILALLGKPLFAVMGSTATLFYLTSDPPKDLTIIFVTMSQIVDQSVFVTIPLFVLAGMLLAESKAPERLVQVSRAFFGFMPGGLAVVAVLSCAFFTAFTGASGVTIVALGGLLYPMLLSERYPERFSLGLITTGGSLGLLFPPSLPIIVYALIAGPLTENQVTVDRLFLAGVLPGGLLVAVLAGYSIWTGKRAGVPRHPFEGRAALAALRGAAFELPIPLIVLGGIYSGLITAIEAAAVVAFYTLVVEVLVYRDIPLARLPEVMRKTAELVGAIIVIIGMALALSNFFIDEEIPQQLLRLAEARITSPLTFLLVLNGLLLVVGCLLDIFSATLVVVPLVAPFAQRYGIDPVHLGVIFLTNLEIGFLTPPVGMNLFLSSLRFGKPMVEVTRSALVFIGLLLCCLLVITYVPWLSTVLVHTFDPVK